MIIGIGVDSTEIARVAAKCAGTGAGSEHPSRFMEKMFTPLEIARSLRNARSPYQHLAACFAAREAFFKATQLWYMRQQVSVAQKPSGEPYFVYSKELERRVKLLGGVAINSRDSQRYFPVQVRLSLTHDDTYATAFVICEAVFPPGPGPFDPALL